MEESITEFDRLRSRNWQNRSVSLLPELLVHIFVSVLRNCGTTSTHKFGVTNMEMLRRARLSLAAVCTRWRDVVISNQVLWTVIMIRQGRHGFARDLFLEELDRSGNSLLSLLVTTPSLVSRFADSRTKDSSAALISAAQLALPRCKIITIHTHQTLAAQLLNCISDVPLPNLQSLSVITDPSNSMSIQPISVDLTASPGLRELRLDLLDINFPGHLTISPNTALRCLEASQSVVSEDIVDILALSHSLEEITWVVLNSVALQPIERLLPSMLCLRRLVLHGKIPLSMLNHFHAPQLVVLEMIYQGLNKFKIPTPALPPLKSVHFPDLRVVYIDGYRRMIRNHEASIANFLAAHSTLQFVSLSEHITEPLAEALCALPSLAHVSARNDQEISTHPLPLIRQWYTKATANPRWKPPTLHLPGVYLPDLWYSEELSKEPALCRFAQQVVLHKQVFKQQEDVPYWDTLLATLASRISAGT
ncbi:hypothetical protein DL93DRAFT_2170387 [Clavulina sp. PMI_390]|nr:hypothetical protein DL93DRAFT_2170387 [Clavulina sp. PMI_390]